MTLGETVSPRRLSSGGVRRFLALFALGTIGVVAAAITGVVGADLPPPLDSQPIVVVIALVSLQSAVLLAVAVVLGLVAAPVVGLRSRVREWATGEVDAWRGFRTELRPAAALGALAGVVLLGVGWLFGPPGAVSGGGGATVVDVLESVPLRFLYGGITEELLLRWGFMAVVAALLWRVTGGERGSLSTPVAWTAILVAAVAFGVGHLPTAASLYGGLTPDVVAFVVVANTLGGLAYGWLFWRHSLEAAMVGHAFTHVVFVAASLLIVAS